MLIPAHIIEELLKIEKEKRDKQQEITIQRPALDSPEDNTGEESTRRGFEKVDFFI